MQCVKSLCILRCKLKPVLKAVNRLMLRAVILKGYTNVLHLTYQKYIAYEHQNSQKSLSQIEQNMALRHLAEQIYKHGRKENEGQHADSYRYQNRAVNHKAPNGLFFEVLDKP